MNRIQIEQVRQAAGAHLLIKGVQTEIEAVTIDSREKVQNSLFVPIVGEKTDGHKYVAGAIENGAKAIFMKEDSAYREEILRICKEKNVAVLAVEDTVAALQNLAQWYRSRFTIPVIGITGSVGKTTTKEMIAAALETEKHVLKTIGNRNSQIGLSLMMLCMEESYDIAVIEMGMSEPGEMEKLAWIARPECAVMTNIGVSHIAQFGSRENIRKEKLAIVNRFVADSSLILNGNDILLQETATQITNNKITIDCSKETKEVLSGTRAVTYGIGKEFDYVAEEITEHADGISFLLKKRGETETVPVKLKVHGEHNVLNALAAIATAERYGISALCAAKGLEAYEPIAMRGQIRQKDGITWIDDSYNASPDSMKSSIRVLLSLEGTRRIVVLADILELGVQAEELHREVGVYLAECEKDEKKTDLVITVGTNAAYIAAEAAKSGIRSFTFQTNAEAEAFLETELKSGDVVLVKGSRGMKTDEIVNAFA